MMKLHDLYGQSFAHEFQFTNPDSIKNAVKRYNLQRAAERDENRKEKEMHKLSKPRFCKMRNTGRDVLGMVTSRDLDVETQMSLRAKQQLLDLQQSSGGNSRSSSCRSRNQSQSSCSNDDQENDVQHGVHRLVGGADTIAPRAANRSKKLRNRKVKRGAAKQKLSDADHYTARIEGLHREVCAELKSMGQTQSELRVASPRRKLKQQRVQKQPVKSQAVANQPQQAPIKKAEQRRKPLMNPESAPVHSEPDVILQRLKQKLNEDEPMIMKQVSYEDYPQPEGQWADIISSPMMPQAVDVNMYEPLTVRQSAGCMFMEQHVPVEPEPLDPYFVEDSDLEQEYADRPGYMRYIERLPYNLSEPDMAENGGPQKACFVELEPHPHWISFQRSLKPMHYTSQRSETDTCTLCEQEEQQQEQEQEQLTYCRSEEQSTATAATDRATGTINHAVHGSSTGRPSAARQQQQQPPPQSSARRYGHRQSPDPVTPANTKFRTPKATQMAQAVRGGGGGGSGSSRQPKRKLLQESPAAAKAQTLGRQPGGRDKEQQQAVVAIPSPQPQPQAELSTAMAAIAVQAPPAKNATPRRKARPVVCTRSLENLKYQKMSIYNKISLTQERIISALDRLQGSLLQLPLISNSSQEKQRRERNAFNFCVRFSRNFLYPLRGMIEDVRCTPVANFNSSTSNEASQRVVCVYGLMYHSIGRYQRQVRYFLLDKVPQKLSALIEMMYTLTNVCLEKGVLDRQDPVVECLQQRCTSFLTFIEDMQEQRFQLARETYRRLQRRVHGNGHGHGQARPGMHERYDLKMFLNDLKLYEPRLVPKERIEKRRPRSWLRKPKLLPDPNSSAQPVPGVILGQPAEIQPEQPTEDVPTHIECVQCGDYRGEPSSELDEEPSEGQKHQLTNILALLQQPGREKRELHQQLLEAMEHVTKSQVREVLDPLVRSLGAMLHKSSQMKPLEE
ncbi:uncharacterized protein LOC115767221 [Drosophila novamexicana]|uniref:uncharacterized protein LOC115767221 n=1 Tax=Drosophila novamexicana TaxID=47314 RepID=UPI0011E59C19|nr:uncharacterized protein LOC115767221 [Drosophila novamexicana]